MSIRSHNAHGLLLYAVATKREYCGATVERRWFLTAADASVRMQELSAKFPEHDYKVVSVQPTMEAS